MAVSSLSGTTTPKSETTIADWHPELNAYTSDLEAAAARSASFIRDMAAGAEPRWLTFTGVAGCGKTMLGMQIFKEATRLNPGNPINTPVWSTGRGFHDESKRRPECIWLTASRFAQRLRDGEYDLPEYLAPDWLVVLDDLGSSRDKSDFVADALYRLCNIRLGKWTVFTTNFTLAELAERVDQRVVSRLIRDRNAVCQISAGDYAMR